MSRLVYLAEIIASSLERWRARCWELQRVPSYASLVVAENEGGQMLFLGLVTAIETGPIDQGRVLATYQKTTGELERDHPELFALLATEISCLSVGFVDRGWRQLVAQLPPVPPPLHAFVREATDDELERFVGQHEYLHLISHRLPAPLLDELLLGFLGHCGRRGLLTGSLLHSFVGTFAELCDQEYGRLRRFVRFAEQLVTSHS
ncbi:MAG: hypothetical protein JW725_01300 [Candidatus Babeliaceae bacterium]|nr:hypothetical protein [Candidatus Babeliaceae bacterium]